MTTTIKLSSPVEAHGEKLSELTFRNPAGADLAKCGFPFRFSSRNGETAREIDTVAMSAMIARLTSVPPSSVDAMAASDWMEAMGVVTDFLGDSAPMSSTSTLPSAISSAA